MLRLFVSNISESKDWCTYWEINKFNQPAPEDYRNDSAFWYNLNGNFELIYTCWRMYLWTGDSSYIRSSLFQKFFEISMGRYIDRWTLQVDSLLNRPTYPNAPMPFNVHDNFHRCRGIPSYYEAVTDMRMSADLIAAIARAMQSYAAIAALNGDKKTVAYRLDLEKNWWNNETNEYYNYYTNPGGFGKGEGETYLLWCDVLTDSSRIKYTINHLLEGEWNVENLSYLSYQLCRYGYFENAYRSILYLTYPDTKRCEYPEVSFGAIEGIVQGIMGVDADAAFNRVTTIYNSHTKYSSELRNLYLLATKIGIKHWDKGTAFSNEGTKPINWRAAFHGRVPYVMVNGKKIKTVQQTDNLGHTKSYIDLQVKPGKSIITNFLP